MRFATSDVALLAEVESTEYEDVARLNPAPDPDLAFDIDGAIEAMTRASARLLSMIAFFDERKLWYADGATSTSNWLCARYGVSWGTALEWVRVARRLRELPRIAEAYAQARLSWDQIRPLTKFATPDTDHAWAARAPSMSPAALYREADRHLKVKATDAEEAHRQRRVALIPDRDSPLRYYIEGILPAEEGATLEAALRARAERVVLADSPEDPAGARMADALLELVTSRDGSGAATPVLVVHADAAALTREEPEAGPWLAETESGRRLPSEAIRRLACDSRIEWVLEQDGRPMGIGRRGRAARGALRRLVRHRDRGRCRFPGCGRRGKLASHHLRHWADGGPTTLDNLLTLCGAHHRLVHEGGWRTSGEPGGDLRFVDRRGRQLRPGLAARCLPLRR
jgi:hypothetical protein